jgi:hypothetical protein
VQREKAVPMENTANINAISIINITATIMVITVTTMKSPKKAERIYSSD